MSAGRQAKRRAMTVIRKADPGDAGRITAILHEDLEENILKATVYGCAGYKEYVRDSIAGQKHGETVFIVSEEKDKVTGYAEYRYSPSGVFLNNICVAASVRGRGAGRLLMHKGIMTADNPGSGALSLDVFSGNTAAKNWYESLGMKAVNDTAWLKFPLQSFNGGSRGFFRIRGLPQAERIHGIYGFSQFTIETAKGSYGVGRLSDALYRCTEPAIANDEDALCGLSGFDPRRQLLLIIPAGSVSGRHEPPYELIASSQRLSGDIEKILSALKSKLRS